MPSRPPCPAAAPRLLCAAVLLVLAVVAMYPVDALATQPMPQRVALAVPAPRDTPAPAGLAAPDTGQPELWHALGGLRRATAVPVPGAEDLARRVLLDACRRDPALRSHWLCHDGP